MRTLLHGCVIGLAVSSFGCASQHEYSAAKAPLAESVSMPIGRVEPSPIEIVAPVSASHVARESAALDDEDEDPAIESLADRASPGAYRVLTFGEKVDPKTATQRALEKADFKVTRYTGTFSEYCPRDDFQSCNPWQVIVVELPGPPDDADVTTALGVSHAGYGVVIKWSSQGDEKPVAPSGSILSKRAHGSRTTYYASWIANAKAPRVAPAFPRFVRRRRQ